MQTIARELAVSNGTQSPPFFNVYLNNSLLCTYGRRPAKYLFLGGPIPLAGQMVRVEPQYVRVSQWETDGGHHYSHMGDGQSVDGREPQNHPVECLAVVWLELTGAEVTQAAVASTVQEFSTGHYLGEVLQIHWEASHSAHLRTPLLLGPAAAETIIPPRSWDMRLAHPRDPRVLRLPTMMDIIEQLPTHFSFGAARQCPDLWVVCRMLWPDGTWASDAYITTKNITQTPLLESNSLEDLPFFYADQPRPLELGGARWARPTQVEVMEAVKVDLGGGLWAPISLRDREQLEAAALLKISQQRGAWEKEDRQKLKMAAEGIAAGTTTWAQATRHWMSPDVMRLGNYLRYRANGAAPTGWEVATSDSTNGSSSDGGMEDCLGSLSASSRGSEMWGYDSPGDASSASSPAPASQEADLAPPTPDRLPSSQSAGDSPDFTEDELWEAWEEARQLIHAEGGDQIGLAGAGGAGGEAAPLPSQPGSLTTARAGIWLSLVPRGSKKRKAERRAGGSDDAARPSKKRRTK